MSRLDDFMELLTGEFDNTRQLRELENEGVADFPFARHKNTVCNDKIDNLPRGFGGVFLVEESSYTTGSYTRNSAHLFLFTQEGEGVKLTAYEIPGDGTKTDFSYARMGRVDYAALKVADSFTPAVFTLEGDTWQGGSVSRFSPVGRFTLHERFSAEMLEVSETMELNGRRTFGYDQPIQYRRITR